MVALGDRATLAPALQPLVVVTAVPVRHHRLCTALSKSTSLLKWSGSTAPKLGNTPLPADSIKVRCARSLLSAGRALMLHGLCAESVCQAAWGAP